MTKIRVYHGTNAAFVPSIRKHGLTSRLGYDSPEWYMVAEDVASAAFHGEGRADEQDRINTVVLEFLIPTERRNGRFMWPGYPYLWRPAEMKWDERETRWYALRQPLPAKFIRRVLTNLEEVHPNARDYYVQKGMDQSKCRTRGAL